MLFIEVSWRPIIGEYRCLVIDLSLSDESHAQHEDSGDQDLDEEHRMGGLGIDSRMVRVTWYSSDSRMPRDTWKVILPEMALHMQSHVPDPILVA